MTSVGNGEPRSRLLVFGLSDGTAVILRHGHELQFPEEGVRVVAPAPEFPVGEAPVVVDPEGQALTAIAVQQARDDTGVAVQTADGRMLLVRYRVRTGFLTGEREVRRQDWDLPPHPQQLTHLQISANPLESAGCRCRRGSDLLGHLSDPAQPVLRDRARVSSGDEMLTALQFLKRHIFGRGRDLRGSSVAMVSGARTNPRMPATMCFFLARAREFKQHSGAITAIKPEYNRKGFVAVDDDGNLGIHYGTSSRTLLLTSFD